MRPAYERESSSFPESLTFQKVRPRSGGALVTSIKYSPSYSGSDGMIAVADVNGTLTIHARISLEILRKYEVATKGGSEVNEIRALAWNPRHTNELYVGFSNGNLIGYQFAIGAQAGEGQDISHRMCFGGAINDIAVNPSGLELAVAYGKNVALIHRPEFGRYNIPSDLVLAPNSQPRKLLYCGETSVIVVSLWNRPDTYACPAAVAYFTHDGAVRWRIFTSAEDIILTAAISPSNDMITIAHAHSGAESYSLPQCQLLIKRDLYAKKNDRKEKFAVDMVFIDEDTVAVGGPSSTITFTDVRSANRPTSTTKPPLGRLTYSLRRLDVLRDSGGGGFWLAVADSSNLSEACDVMQFTDLQTTLSRDTTRKASWPLRSKCFSLLFVPLIVVAWLARKQVHVLIKGVAYLITMVFRKMSSDQVIAAPPPTPKSGGYEILSWSNLLTFGSLSFAVGVRWNTVAHYMGILWAHGQHIIIAAVPVVPPPIDIPVAAPPALDEPATAAPQ